MKNIKKCTISLIIIICSLNFVSASIADISINDYNTNSEIVNTDININISEKYGTSTFIVGYNPSIIHVADVQCGDFSEIVDWNADNTNGQVTISTWNITGISGNFTLATLAFKPISNGKSQLDINIDLLLDINYCDIPVNTSNGSITVNMKSSSSGSSGGGGGGGGGGTSGEAFENILISETEREYVNKGSDVCYTFNSEGNIIQFINFTALSNSGKISTKVEILKKTSSFAEEVHSDIIYQNLNILVGNSGWASSNNIADPTINFKVDKSWINKNNIDISSIRLNRYSNEKWNSLTTTKTGENTLYLYFKSETPGFSSFVITGKKKSAASSSYVSEDHSSGSNNMEDAIIEKPDQVLDQTNVNEQPGFAVLTGIFMVLIAVWILRNKNQ